MRRIMKFAVLGLAAVVPVSLSIAASKSPKLARCDGKQRRPANPYGSILPTVDPASGTVSPATATQRGVDVFPLVGPAKPNSQTNNSEPPEKPLPQIPPISAVAPSALFGSC
jgi:hypothetical protein